jgi:glycerophosphoryl diester phosphodiesterase
MRFPARPLLIAHRGESHDAPENTLAAVRLAWERGAHAVEIDVHLSSDGELVVLHDFDTRRIGGSRTPVARQTAAALRAIDAGAWKHRRWRGEKIPLLSEVLATVPEHGRLFIEIKAGPACVPPLARLLAAGPLEPRQIVVMSFDVATVADAARAFSRSEVCLLLSARQWLPRGALARAIEQARAMGCRGLDLQTHRRLDAAVIEAAHAAGLRVYVWTVDRVPVARRLAEAGIDGITTNRRAWLAAQCFPASAKA